MPVLILAFLGAAAGCTQRAVPSAVQAVIDRSKASRANYAVIMTVEVVRDGQRSVQVNAEFQQAAMHRVEVPDTRVLSNCDTGESATYDVAGARIVDRQDASEAACGIAVGADPVISSRLLAPVTGPFGRADVIELVGADFVRRYTVTDDGIIVANDYRPRRREVGFSLRSLSATLRRGPQDPAMFDERSLGRAFAAAPDRTDAAASAD